MIRRSEPRDAAALIRFMETCSAETDMLGRMAGEFRMTVKQERAWIREHAERRGCVSLVAEVDARIVGACGATSEKLLRYAHRPECGIAIAKSYWKLGIGRKMMEALLSWARKQRLSKLVLRVFADNRPAIRLYRSLGFVREGRFREDALRADGSYTDTLYMARYLTRSK